jgi:hypothetical protein
MAVSTSKKVSPLKKSFFKCSLAKAKLSGVHLNFSSKSSICKVKAQTTQVSLDLNSRSVICNPGCVHNGLFNASFEDKFK